MYGECGFPTWLGMLNISVYSASFILRRDIQTQKHILRSLQRQQKQTVPMVASVLASIALGIINPALAGGALAATTTSFAQSAITYTRNHEFEADRIGIQMLYHAQFNPDSMATFFDRLQQRERLYYTDHIPPILRTHPLDYERIAEAKQRSRQFATQPTRESKEYPLIKEYIRALTSDDYQKLQTYYQEKLKKFPSNPAYQLGAALAALHNRQWRTATELLTTLIKQDPQQLIYQQILASVYLDQNASQKAVDLLQPIFVKHPNNYPLLLHYAQALMRNQQPELARKILQKESYQRRTDIQLWQLLSRAQAAAGRTADAYASRAEMMILLGYHRDALRQLEHALSLVQDQRLATARISARIDDIKQMIKG